MLHVSSIFGPYIDDCTLAGEGKSDGVFPAHPNGIQLSHNRFLVLYATRGHRGIDDDLSGIYQLRADSWDGPILRENWVAKTQNDWDALGDGNHYVRQIGHPTAFGVPKGALVQGKRVAHENHFVAMWRQVAVSLNPQTGLLGSIAKHAWLWDYTTSAQWRQFRLNDAEDDIEWITEQQTLRLPGCENPPHHPVIPGHPDIAFIFKGFTSAVPANDACDTWIDVNTTGFWGGAAARREGAGGRGLITCLYRFDEKSRRYECTEYGIPSKRGFYEGSVARAGKHFVIMARMGGKAFVAYHVTDDPIGEPLNFIPALDQPSAGPRTLFNDSSGDLWKLGGSSLHSPYKQERNPIYMTAIDAAKGCRAGECHVIRDGTIDNPGIPSDVWMDFPKLLAHMGGNEQWILYRLRGTGVRHNPPGDMYPDPELTPTELHHSGIYAAKVCYSQPQPATWTFDLHQNGA